MNPALMAAMVAAQHSETPDPVDRLKKAGAVSSDQAIAIDPATPAEAKLIDAAIEQRLVSRRADGRLYVNQRAVAERDARVGHQLLIGSLIGLSILASAAALLFFAR